MIVARKFLDWTQPALPLVAEYLLDRYLTGTPADMSGAVVIVPGRRAGRRLLELLVDRAEQRQLLLIPPEIDTVGGLPERLYTARMPFASDTVNIFAWTWALRHADPEHVRAVIPERPDDEDHARWQAYGRLLWKQHRELAAEDLQFIDVVDHGPRIAGFNESKRWQALAAIQRLCLDRLDELQLWDRQSARLFAVRHEECRTDKDIVLVGTADLNQTMKRMLDQVSDRVTALVVAPESLADNFDQYGCILADSWADRRIDISANQIDVVDGPSDQAKAVARQLAEYDGRYRADEITIGMTDEDLVPDVQRQLQMAGISARWVVGQKFGESSVCRLMQCLADYLDSGTYEAFAALVRHPDISDWLDRQPALRDAASGTSRGWLWQVDRYFNHHLPHLVGKWYGPTAGFELVRRAHDSITALLSPLASPEQNLAEWSVPLAELLAQIYGDVEFDLDDPQQSCTVAAIQRLTNMFEQLAEVPEAIAPQLTAAAAIRLSLQQLTGDVIPSPHDEEAVEMLGWLELPLDDAPALIVTTFNEGYVPGSLNSDLFLPDALRRQMQLLDNRRRYARDAYALSVLLKSRESLKLIVGRRNREGDPLRPSRLLFATEGADAAMRALQCFAPAETAFEVQPSVENTCPDSGEERSHTALQIPRPLPLTQPLDHLSVTAFGNYIACPYRFYLKHVLRLSEVNDNATEMDALMFGNLMHEVLRRFGGGDQRNSRNADVIRRELDRHLMDCRTDIFGSRPLPAVRVQMMQLQERLHSFADWQANHAAEGWQMLHVESEFKGDTAAVLNLDDGRSIRLEGRIDRIDYHPENKEYAVFDYKSGEAAKRPDKTHRKKKKWIDLQLPLYRILVRNLTAKSPVRLGYILLPSDKTKVGAAMAEWTEDELHEAEQLARRIAADIMDEKFWPPADNPEKPFSEFAAICQQDAFDAELVG